jgi:hypothetical protein
MSERSLIGLSIFLGLVSLGCYAMALASYGIL